MATIKGLLRRSTYFYLSIQVHMWSAVVPGFQKVASCIVCQGVYVHSTHRQESWALKNISGRGCVHSPKQVEPRDAKLFTVLYPCKAHLRSCRRLNLGSPLHLPGLHQFFTTTLNKTTNQFHTLEQSKQLDLTQNTGTQNLSIGKTDPYGGQFRIQNLNLSMLVKEPM